MRNIVCLGDSNTWGFDGSRGGERFAPDQVWPGVMAERLGAEYRVFQAGMCGRTTVFEDPIAAGRRGIDVVEAEMSAAAPVDLLIIMLGTNDCKERLHATPEEIAAGLEQLAGQACALPLWRGEPRVLLVMPAMIQPGYAGENSPVAGTMGRGCREKCLQLPRLYRELAQRRGWDYFDSNLCCTVNTVDYIHLDRESHRRLGECLAERAEKLLDGESKETSVMP